MRYAIADTAWGPVLFAATGTATGDGLRRLLLPLRPTADSRAFARATARRQWPGADYVPNLLPQLQRQIVIEDPRITGPKGNRTGGGVSDCDRLLERLAQPLVRLEPLAPAYGGRGAVKRYTQDPDGALRDFNRALALDPNLAKAYANRGTLHMELGNTKI